jgi:hypothetical protein
MLSMPIPTDLCPEHKRIARAYRDLRYDWRRPTEWPGGQHILDSRTSHAERSAGWDRKSREQIELVIAICRSGNSPQCNREAEVTS